MRSGQGFLNDLRPTPDVTAAVAQPALVIATRKDGGVPFTHAESLAATIRHAQLVESQADTHFIWFGDDWPTIAQTIRAFLDTDPRPPQLPLTELDPPGSNRERTPPSHRSGLSRLPGLSGPRGVRRLRPLDSQHACRSCVRRCRASTHPPKSGKWRARGVEPRLGAPPPRRPTRFGPAPCWRRGRNWWDRSPYSGLRVTHDPGWPRRGR
ncbi:MAG: alpha/beta fold hydrolase [Acidimicrobiia bacterium]